MSRATLCEYNDARRKFGTLKWPKPTRYSKFPHTFCIEHFVCARNNKAYNPRHMIDTSDSRPDLERAVNSD